MSVVDDDPFAFSLEALTPHIADPGLVEDLLKEKYGLEVTSLTPLNGWDDKNYCAKIKDGHSNPFLDDVSVREFFVKVINSRDSKNLNFSNSQRLVMKHLDSHGISCQREIKMLDGNYFAKLTVDKKGEMVTYLVSVRTFLPGEIVAKQIVTQPLLFELGAYVRRIHTALQSFHDHFYDTFDCSWSLNNVGAVRSVVHCIASHEVERRKVVLEVLDAFEMDVLPRREEFRKDQIHGDLNEQNILVRPDAGSASGLAVSGLLDFQDTARTHPLYDLAILMAYMMMVPETEVPALEMPGFLLAGYTDDDGDHCHLQHRHHHHHHHHQQQKEQQEQEEQDHHRGATPLPEAEWACLRTAIASRMVMSLVYGAYTYSQSPDNEYLLSTACKGWDVLTEFWRADREAVEGRWKEVMGSYRPDGDTEP